MFEIAVDPDIEPRRKGVGHEFGFEYRRLQQHIRLTRRHRTLPDILTVTVLDLGELLDPVPVEHPARGATVRPLEAVLCFLQPVERHRRRRVAGTDIAGHRNTVIRRRKHPERLAGAGADQKTLFLGHGELVSETLADQLLDRLLRPPQQVIAHLDPLGERMRGQFALAEFHRAVFVPGGKLRRPFRIVRIRVEGRRAQARGAGDLVSGRPLANKHFVVDKPDQLVDERFRCHQETAFRVYARR